MFSVTIVENEDERNLHFSSVQEGDEGSYYCVATNNYSLPMSRTSSIARLTVNGNGQQGWSRGECTTCRWTLPQCYECSWQWLN